MFVSIVNCSIAISNICSDEQGNCYNNKNNIWNKPIPSFSRRKQGELVATGRWLGE